YVRSGDLQLPADYRLAFRELGLAIGLHAVRLMWQANEREPGRFPPGSGIRARLKALMQYTNTGEAIESFWRAPEHRRARTWSEHLDINEVMLATSLAPEGFLVLSSIK
ncbi:MAG TPA: hypothetical protein VLU73_16435, partial [Methylococcaceae bacterium]|nr:hypothetical protein [Methylococcaceae bacterium]